MSVILYYIQIPQTFQQRQIHIHEFMEAHTHTQTYINLCNLLSHINMNSYQYIHKYIERYCIFMLCCYQLITHNPLAAIIIYMHKLQNE